MGRIDDALRRAGENAPSSPLSVAATTPFVSPWTVAAAPEAPPAPERRAATLVTSSRAGQFFQFAPSWNEKLVAHHDADHALVEQFRRLAGALHHAQVAEQIKVLMVTSARPADGKTLTALNLALTLSRSYGRRVLLVDADLRRPSISRICGVASVGGLSDGLRSTVEQKLSLVQLGEGLTLLPAGEPDPDPMSSLTSSRMKSILSEAAENFDWVILDAPPAGPLADAGLLAAMADRVLLVVRALQTPHAAVEKAIDALGRDRIFGVILNGVDKTHTAGYAHYSSYGPQRVSEPSSDTRS